MSKESDYLCEGNQKDVFRCAFDQQLPLLLKGPTGCGKTRFVEHMAAQLNLPLVSVACHEDLTAADLVGRFLLRGGDTIWVDGPLTKALKQGGICYLDEIVEARADTTVVIHPLADHRRELYIERIDQTIAAPDNFMLVVSYNPGYQSVLKDLKPSTRQRFISIDMDYPSTTVEQAILVQQTGIEQAIAENLVKLANAIRQLEVAAVPEVASTRTLISAARLIKAGLHPHTAVECSVIAPLSDDKAATKSLSELIAVYMGNNGD